MDKVALRKTIMNQRLKLDSSDVDKASKKICEKIIAKSEYKASKVVYMYYPINNEVDVTYIIEDCLKNGRIVALPKTINGELEFHPINSLDELKPGAYNIPEPTNDEIAPEPDLIIVPGVAFSNDGMRVGYGGGYYDRFLSTHSVHSIGVCYLFQLLSRVPTMSHDQRLDEIVYEETNQK